MTQRTLRLDVEQRIKTWAASKSPAIAVAYEGVPFTKPNTEWVELYIIPAVTVNSTLETKRKTLRGSIQINIYTKDGTGTKKAELLADELIALFPPTIKTPALCIEQTGHIMNHVNDAQWRVTPVRFEYRQEDY